MGWRGDDEGTVRGGRGGSVGAAWGQRGGCMWAACRVFLYARANIAAA